MKLLGGDTHLAAQSELSAVGKAGGGVPVYRRAVHPGQEAVGGLPVAGDNGLGVAGGVLPDVVDRLLQAVHHFDGQDVIQKLSIKVLRSGGDPVNDSRRGGVQTQLNRVEAFQYTAALSTWARKRFAVSSFPVTMDSEWPVEWAAMWAQAPSTPSTTFTAKI